LGISRKTGIRKNRLSELSIKENAKIRGDEIVLISLAMEVESCELLNEVCGHKKLPN